MSDVNAQLFYVGETHIFIWPRAFFMHFEVWCCNNNMQKLWLALTFQSEVLKQLVSYGFVSNNNMKYIATTYWLIAKSTGYPISVIIPLA